MKQPRSGNHPIHQSSGFVLVITLWVVIVLSTVALAYIRHVTLEMNMVAFQRDVAIVDSLAKTGLQQAFILLREDLIKDMGENFTERNLNFLEEDTFRYDAGSEAWADNPELYIDVPFYERNEQYGYYYVDVRDESAKLPINSSQVTLEMIAKLLELTGVEEDRALNLAAAIQDFRDADLVPTSTGDTRFGRDGGDETSFYNERRRSRSNEIPPFPMKNGTFSSIDELLLVPGMTPAIVFGTVEPEESTRGGRFSGRRLRQGEYLGLKNYVTVYGGRTNINTVKREVLEAILFAYVGDEAERMASDWVDYRNGRDRIPYTEDDRAIKTPDNSDLDDVHYTEVNGFTEQLMAQMANLVVNYSSYFEVACLAEYKGIQKGYTALVYRNWIPWTDLPQFGWDTNNPEDLEQVVLQVKQFEPLFNAKDQINKML